MLELLITCRNCQVGHTHKISEIANKLIALTKKNSFQRLSGAMRRGAMCESVFE